MHKVFNRLTFASFLQRYQCDEETDSKVMSKVTSRKHKYNSNYGIEKIDKSPK